MNLHLKRLLQKRSKYYKSTIRQATTLAASKKQECTPFKIVNKVPANMNEIKLSFNEEQFKALQKLLYLGNWMLTSMDDHPDKNFKVEEEVEQMIYAHSDTSVSEFSKEFKMFFPPADFEEEMNVLIEDYDQYTFWDELANQLAERDARNELGKQYDKMNKN